MKQSGRDSIRLTNQTARALRARARQEQLYLHIAAVTATLLLFALTLYLGTLRILYVPLVLLGTLLLDAVLLRLARGRYLQLSALALCTEAAVRIMRGEKAEQQRIIQTEQSLGEIHRDLAAHAPQPREETEDDDLFGETPQTAAYVGAVSDAVPDAAPLRRRRRQARLQLLPNEDAK